MATYVHQQKARTTLPYSLRVTPSFAYAMANYSIFCLFVEAEPEFKQEMKHEPKPEFSRQEVIKLNLKEEPPDCRCFPDPRCEFRCLARGVDLIKKNSEERVLLSQQ